LLCPPSKANQPAEEGGNGKLKRADIRILDPCAACGPVAEQPYGISSYAQVEAKDGNFSWSAVTVFSQGRPSGCV